MQPLNFIANYYGEKIALYYSWLLFYTAWLSIPAVPGLALFGYQMYVIIQQYRAGIAISMDNPFNVLFCLIMAIWSTIMIEVWKRRENELIHLWGMSGFKGDEAELPDFKYDYKIDTRQKNIKKENLYDTYIRRLAGELPTVIFGIAIVIGLFVGYFIYSKTFKDPVNSFGSSAINACIIITLGAIYRGIAKKLVAWENH